MKNNASSPKTFSQPIWYEAIPDHQRFPALNEKIHADVVIVGGGIVGLLTAWHLHMSGKKVVLVEKNHLGTGDSGATTAFLTRVPDAEITGLITAHGTVQTKKILTAAAGAQEELFSIIENERIDCDFTRLSSFYGSFVYNDPKITSEFKTLSSVLNQDIQKHHDPSKAFFPLAIEFPHEGTMHIRKFLSHLVEKISSTIQIFEQTPITEINEKESFVLTTDHGQIEADHVIVTSGNPTSLFPETKDLIKSFLTYVTTAVMPKPLLPKGLFWDISTPYFYFRAINDHTLMVGGADIAANKTTTQNAQAILQKFLNNHFPESHPLTHFWSGSLFETPDGLPYVFPHPHFRKPLWIATGFSGNGLVFGALAARILSQAVKTSSPEYADLFSLQRTGVILPQRASVPKTSAASSPHFVSLGALADFPENKPVCQTVNNLSLAVFRLRDKVYVIDNMCSHAGGSLCDGILNNKTIECPLHASRFNIETGEVLNPPAVRPQKTYRTQIRNGHVEVEICDDSLKEKSKDKTPSNIPSQEKHWGKLFRFIPIPILLWVIEFFLQYFWISRSDLPSSLVRSFSFAGATLIAAALFSSAIFKWIPRYAKYWRIRRYLGVSGFIFIALHVLSAYHFFFDYQFSATYFSFNPLRNPIVFGSIAFMILFVMAATSTDWAMDKLTPKRWKFIHRFVYVAEISAIFHFLQMNPSQLKTLPGYFLLFLMSLVVLGQLYWWIRISAQQHFRRRGFFVGLLLLVLVFLLTALVY